MTEPSLQQVLDLAQLQRQKEAERDDLKKQLKKVEEDIARISEALLPDLMLSFQPPIRFMGLDDGGRVDVVSKVTANIPAISTCIRNPEKWDERNAALEWFEESGNGAMVKHNIISQFDTDQDEDASFIYAWLSKQAKERGFVVRDQRDIHHSTLEAFVREQLGKGVLLPEDLLKIHRFNVAKITPPPKD